jgi:hypothetical protein
MRVALPTILVFLCAALPGFSQVERASIVGTIRDSSGSVIPGVSVKITNEGTNTSVTLNTDAACDYSATNLIPGTYSIEG